MSAFQCRVFQADFLAPLIGTAPYPKYPSGIAYGKWVAMQFEEMWYIELGYMNEYHADLEHALKDRLPNVQLEGYIDGTIAQRGGPGSALTIRSNAGKIPDEISLAISHSLLEAQRGLKRKTP